jgi:hypothetical protein
MSRLIVNSQTKEQIDNYLKNPGQSVGLIGQKWLNKGLIAVQLAAFLLEIPESELQKYPYLLTIADPESKSIGIDEVRKVNSFTRLTVPSKKEISRIVIIEGASLMTQEAQNALLKNLEEPPKGTIFILTADSIKSLLPTIISRLNVINVIKPPKEDLIEQYESDGYDKTEISQAYLISGGLPGLIDLMLSSDDHPLNTATKQARQLLLGTTFDRLNMINDLAKDKSQFKNILFIIKQMSKVGLSSSDPTSANRWQRILSACLDSETKMNSNGQTKLLLTNFMLSLT